MKNFDKLEQKISINFENKNLLKEAFTHRSYLNENPSWNVPHNERLEFLGDAVLELIVTEFLFEKFPKKPEGELTSLRAALVNTNMLSEVANELGLNDYILLSKGEAKDKGRARQYILTNTFEALIGAIYLDQKYKDVEKFVHNTLLEKLDEVLEKKLFIDSKSYFQEKAQEIVGITPHYEVLKESGPDHAKNFVVGVFIGEEMIDQGEGPSKQEAQQQAAEKALKNKGWE